MWKYKGYSAIVKIDYKDALIVGEVIDVKDPILFEAKDVEEAEQEFHYAVDAYLEFCEAHNKKPEKPFSGKMPFRTTPSLHKKISLAAAEAGQSINSWMEDKLHRATTQSPKSTKGAIELFFQEHSQDYDQLVVDIVDSLGINDIDQETDVHLALKKLIKELDKISSLPRKNKFSRNDVAAFRKHLLQILAPMTKQVVRTS